jgi:hypothetical protein
MGYTCVLCKQVAVNNKTDKCVNCFEVTLRFHEFVSNARGLRWALAVINKELNLDTVNTNTN